MVSLIKLYERVRDLETVSTQAEFSRLWGKGDSWYSTSVARKRPPGLDALTRFFISLEQLETDTRQAAANADDEETADCYRGGAEDVAEIKADVWKQIVSICGKSVAGRP